VTEHADTPEPGVPESIDISESIAEAVLATDGVAGLHGGMFGEAATYLPGRRVAGIRIDENGTEVHVTLIAGHPVRETADAIRTAVSPLSPGPVHVTVEDVVRA
jgi:hypothetical protein